MDIRQALFRYRSYTPLPVLLVMLIFAHPTVATLIVGFLIALVGEGIRLWGVSIAGSETRTTGIVGGTYLITTGPFAHVRNPLYLGNLLLYLGIGAMSNALFPWLLILSMIAFGFQYYWIVTLEEEYLGKTFGAAFAEYTREVPRFVPRLKKYRGGMHPQPECSLQKGLRSEMRTLQAILVISLALVLLWQLRS